MNARCRCAAALILFTSLLSRSVYASDMALYPHADDPSVQLDTLRIRVEDNGARYYGSGVRTITESPILDGRGIFYLDFENYAFDLGLVLNRQQAGLGWRMNYGKFRFTPIIHLERSFAQVLTYRTSKVEWGLGARGEYAFNDHLVGELALRTVASPEGDSTQFARAGQEKLELRFSFSPRVWYGLYVVQERDIGRVGVYARYYFGD